MRFEATTFDLLETNNAALFASYDIGLITAITPCATPSAGDGSPVYPLVGPAFTHST